MDDVAQGRSPALRWGEGQLIVSRLGLIDYQQAWQLQKVLAAARRQDLIPNVLLLLEHPHTYTLGRRGKREHILLTPGQLKGRKIAVYEVDRGGDVTYHGPDQLVGYPIFKLASRRLDFVRYIRDVEAALLHAVRDLGAPGELKEGFSGVWIGEEKVCAIGVKVDASGVTSHGFALNVNADLSYFDHIIPCGIRDKGVISLDRVLGRRVSMRRAMDAVVARLAERFELTPRGMALQRLDSLLAKV
jgi:lipoyl(octanoyl) transferase